MKAREVDPEGMPAELATFDPAGWTDRGEWRRARLDWLKVNGGDWLGELRAGIAERAEGVT